MSTTASIASSSLFRLFSLSLRGLNPVMSDRLRALGRGLSRRPLTGLGSFGVLSRALISIDTFDSLFLSSLLDFLLVLPVEEGLKSDLERVLQVPLHLGFRFPASLGLYKLRNFKKIASNVGD